jgi:hypothetical protein
VVSTREFYASTGFKMGNLYYFVANRWVEGALDSAYEAVRKILEGAGLEEYLEKLDANWGNPHLDKAEAEEHKSLLREQELIGALFSTISDRDEIKRALEEHFGQSSLAARAAQKA